MHSSRYSGHLSEICLFLSILVHWFLRCWCLLFHLLLDHIQFNVVHGPNIPGFKAILFFTASDFTFTARDIHNWASFLLWHSHFILSEAICKLPSTFHWYHIGHLLIWGTHLPISYLFVFLYCSWCSCSRNTGVVFLFPSAVDHILTEFSLWPIRLGWPCRAQLIASLSYTRVPSPQQGCDPWRNTSPYPYPTYQVLWLPLPMIHSISTTHFRFLSLCVPLQQLFSLISLPPLQSICHRGDIEYFLYNKSNFFTPQVRNIQYLSHCAQKKF